MPLCSLDTPPPPPRVPPLQRTMSDHVAALLADAPRRSVLLCDSSKEGEDGGCARGGRRAGRAGQEACAVMAASCGSGLAYASPPPVLSARSLRPGPADA